jgi:hypothetical protein
MPTYYVDDTILLKLEVREEEDGPLVDPGTIEVLIKRTGDTGETTYVYGVDSSLTRTSTGLYVMTFVPSVKGRYRYIWRTVSESRVTSIPGTFAVDALPFT